MRIANAYAHPGHPSQEEIGRLGARQLTIPVNRRSDLRAPALRELHTASVCFASEPVCLLK